MEGVGGAPVDQQVRMRGSCHCHRISPLAPNRENRPDPHSDQFQGIEPLTGPITDAVPHGCGHSLEGQQRLVDFAMRKHKLL